MTLTEEQRAAICAVSGLLTAIGCPQCHSYLQKNYTHHIEVLRAMIDSSGTVDYDGLRCESCGKTLTEIRGSKYAGDYCMGEIRLDPGQEASRSDPPIESCYYFWCDECKNDSSDQFNEPDELISFDLEKVKADLGEIGDPRFCDCEVRTQLAEAIAEIERLRSAIRTYREREESAFSEIEMKDEFLVRQNARIKELEDAHKRSGKKYAKIINELRSSVYANIPGLKKQWDEILNAPANGKIGPDDSKKISHLRPYEVVAADLAGMLAQSWQITEERIGLLEYCLETLLDAPDIEEIPGPGHSIEMLRAMLREADHDKP